MTVHEARFRVRYAETDQMGVVYYANYLIWMELGRVEYCRQAGIRYRDMEAEDGILLAVAEAHCRYLHPARYDDEIVVQTHISKAHARMIVFEYAIRRGDGQLLARGETKHIFCGRDFQPCRLPAKYHAAFGVGGLVARAEPFDAL
ncbi:MAG TPA: thioesterase family protein [Bryobacteraceae bacterium]|jgi:acyl-CoA thioester hydrolase|nr:thioesterase family protein [Bryobacteraceae bacterium]